jgi:hypothetical protein
MKSPKATRLVILALIASLLSFIATPAHALVVGGCGAIEWGKMLRSERKTEQSETGIPSSAPDIHRLQAAVF